MGGYFSKTGAKKIVLFTEKEWSGFTWLLKILSVYMAASVIITLLYEYTPSGPYQTLFLVGVSFPIYILILGLVLGVPAFNLCRAVIARQQSKGKAIALVLAIMALFCACVIIPQIILTRLLPVFTSILVLLFICFFFLFGCWTILKLIVREIRDGFKN